MFGRKTEETRNAAQDMNTLMENMDRIISGDFSDVDVSVFHNCEYGEKLNQLIHAFKNANNTYVMRLNEAMTEVGDNSNVKNMLDQVEVQANSIMQIDKSSHTLEESIENISESMAAIRDNTNTIYSVSQNGTANMNASIKAVNESSEMIEDINRQVQEFQEKIDRITEIVTIVKNIASQSNLLALNASIEASRAGVAGRGFSVVAEQVRQMSTSTKSSAEDIVNYVTQLKKSIATLVDSMKITTDKLSESNGMVENSLKDMEDLNSKISIINTSINSIFNDIDKQSQITRDFAMQVSDLNESYGILSDTCNSTGSQVYKMGRNIDKCRTDMAKHYSDLTELDWIKIFEVDHFILMWRVYNHVVGFENLRITQLNNPNSCKLGRWMNNISDSHITASSEFRMVEKTHKAIHRNAVLAWEAKAAHNVELAMSYFDKTREAYSQFQDSIQGLMLLLRALGYTSMTEIIPYVNNDKDKMKRAI